QTAPLYNITTTESPMVWTALSDDDGVWSVGESSVYASYYAIYIHSPSTRNVMLQLEYDDYLRVWMDGLPDPIFSNVSWGSGTTELFSLTQGVHRFVFKIYNDGGGDLLAVKFVDEDGGDSEGLRYTLEDIIAPRVASVFPAANATGVPLWTDVTIRFSELMDTSVDASTIAEITGATPDGTWSWANEWTLVWTPNSVLEPEHVYTVLLDSSQARDVRGNTLSGTSSSIFTTIVSRSQPAVTTVSPHSERSYEALTLTITGEDFRQGPIHHPVGALLFDGHYYHFPGTWPNWQSAQADSAVLGGHLATISSVEEDEFVWRLGGYMNFWIGLTDAAQEGVFEWVNDEDVTYTNWSPGEPDDWGYEDYGVYWYGLKWNDVPSSATCRRPYVVEFDTPVPPTVSLAKAGCSDIVATSVSLIDGNMLTCDIDLAGAAPGNWSVVLTNSDGAEAVLDDAFTVLPSPIINSFYPESDECNGLAWGDDHLWLLGASTILKIDPATGATVQTVELPSVGYVQGLAWADGTLVYGDNDEGSVYLINPATGDEVLSFAMPSGVTGTGLAWDGQFLWLMDDAFWTPEKLFRIDHTDGTVVDSFETPERGQRGMEWSGEYLWCASAYEGLVRQIDPANGREIGSFPSIAPGSIHCLAWDGTWVWVYEPSEGVIYQTEIDTVPPPALTLSPRNSTIVSSQSIDLCFIARTRGLNVEDGTAFLNGMNITDLVIPRLVKGRLDQGGVTCRIPGATTSGPLALGDNTLYVSLNLSDGSAISDSATYTLMETVEAYQDPPAHIAPVSPIIEGSPTGTRVEISPASGRYATSQTVDMCIILHEPGDAGLTGVSIVVDGKDMTELLLGKVLPGTLVGGGFSCRIPGISVGSIIGVGLHTMRVSLELSDGTIVSDVVVYEVVKNTE
ncbi:Ig-like domain-containing protein, partial [Planctomycetota bacterium]